MCLFFRASDRDRSTVCHTQSVFLLVHFSKISSMPLCKACPGFGGMVHIRKVSCSCGHVFISKCSKPRLTARSCSRKHTMSSFRAIETDEKAADRRSVNRACKGKKRALETEQEALERKSHDRALASLVLCVRASCVYRWLVVSSAEEFKQAFMQGLSWLWWYGSY